MRAAVRRRRGRYLSLAAAGAFLLGCMPLLLGPLLIVGLGLFGGAGGSSARGLFGLLWPAIYTVMGVSTLYARLRGISIG